MGETIIIKISRRNPLKTGLVTASSTGGAICSDKRKSRSSQSPENGSRHCKSKNGPETLSLERMVAIP